MRIVALLIAPLLPALVASLVVAMKVGGFESDTPATVAFGCLMAGYAAALLFGLPLSFLWHRLGFGGVFGGISLGVVSAVGVTVLVFPLLHPLRVHEVSASHGLLNLLSFAVPLGALGGVVFWWLGVRSVTTAWRATRGTRAPQAERRASLRNEF